MEQNNTSLNFWNVDDNDDGGDDDYDNADDNHDDVRFA